MVSLTLQRALRDEGQERVFQAGIALARLGAQLIQGALSDEATFRDHTNPVGHALGDIQNMRRHDDRTAITQPGAQHILHRPFAMEE